MNTRQSFRYFQVIPTRWADNDVYGHVNNVTYYSYFDTIINTWLIEQGGLDIHRGQSIGLCVESSCKYFAPVAFPEEIEAGLRLGKLGSSSVRYEIGIFRKGQDAAVAVGWFVHVFVDRSSRRPKPTEGQLRAALEVLVIAEAVP